MSNFILTVHHILRVDFRCTATTTVIWVLKWIFIKVRHRRYQSNYYPRHLTQAEGARLRHGVPSLFDQQLPFLQPFTIYTIHLTRNQSKRFNAIPRNFNGAMQWKKMVSKHALLIAHKSTRRLSFKIATSKD